MKKCLLLLFASVLIFTSCNKNGGSENGRTQYPSTVHVIRNAVKDVDGNMYDAVRIGEQVWMASNLKTTHYADGTEIPQEDTEDTRHCPANNPQTVDKYGYLYSWPAVMHGEPSSYANPSGVQGICPNGWHVPSGNEWYELETTIKKHLHSEETVVQALAANDSSWMPSPDSGEPGFNPALNNSTGFSAVPAGYYGIYQNGILGYSGFGNCAIFWSTDQFNSSQALYYLLYYSSPVVYSDYAKKYCGYSVRCLRN